MSRQYNKAEKRKRRQAYIKRKKTAAKAPPKAAPKAEKTAAKAEPAAPPDQKPAPAAPAAA